jgi:hypothetical protein
MVGLLPAGRTETFSWRQQRYYHRPARAAATSAGEKPCAAKTNLPPLFLAKADDESMLLRNTWSERHASENRMYDGLGVGKVRTRGLSVGLSLCTHPRGYSVISHEAVRRLSLVIILALLERLLCTSDQSNSAGPRRRPSQPWIASCPTPSNLSSRLGDGPPVGSTQSRSNRNKWYRHGRR